ncbi:RPGR, partial [Symbiodinium sp. KB8]
DWVATVMGSGSGGLDKLVGTQQPRHKSLADVVRELRKRKPTLLSVGGNDAGQLGIGTVNASGSPHPKEVKSLSAKYAPVAVSAGESHVACVTAGGSVMVWGDGDGGQLGVGEGLQRSPRPYLLKGLRQFKACSVACGSYHTLVSVEGGRVYAFGDGSGWGELGLATPRVCWEPTPVLGLPMDRGPPSVFCGRVTSGALFSDGSCYMWGCNATGQCGSAPPACADADATTRSALMQTTPALVEVDPALGLGSSRVVAAAAGDYFTLFVVGAERALVVAGWTNVSRADRELVTAGDRSTLWEAAGVSAGDDSIFALRHARESPLSGLRGEPSEEELAAADAPFPITAILDVSAGHRHGAAVRGNGVVLMVGRGLLGLPPDSAAACLSARRKDAVHDGDTAAGDAFVATTDFVRVPSLVLEGCVAVSCGADHTVVGTRSGRLLSFGAADVAQTGTGHYGWAIEPEACEAFAMPMHHVEAFSAGGCFTAAISYPGARGAAQERELATKWCDVWMRKALGRGLGERVYDKAEVAGEIDAIAAAMAREAGLGAVLMQ